METKIFGRDPATFARTAVQRTVEAKTARRVRADNLFIWKLYLNCRN
jgi:hypothetical protein